MHTGISNLLTLQVDLHIKKNIEPIFEIALFIWLTVKSIGWSPDLKPDLVAHNAITEFITNLYRNHKSLFDCM